MANKALVKKLDVAFSKFIRLRDSKDGMFRCCSCGQLKPYGSADAGHYINRKHMATRWREDNVHAQCSACNRFDEGNIAGYSLFMINKYGLDHINFLNGLKTITQKYTDFELELLIKEYRDKLKNLEKYY